MKNIKVYTYMEINRRDFITKMSAIAALSVLPSSFVAAMGNEKVEKAVSYTHLMVNLDIDKPFVMYKSRQ